MSRITARESAAPEMIAPCRMRKTRKVQIPVASAQPSEARMKIIKPASSTGRRPKRSDSGPMMS